MASGIDHDALIARLHEVTGLETERCHQVLESVDWDLQQACHLALANDEHPVNREQLPFTGFGNNPLDLSAQKLQFQVHFEGMVSEFVLPDSVTVGQLKEQIKVAAKLPSLIGLELEWPKGTEDPFSDNLPLRYLHLPTNPKFILTRKFVVEEDFTFEEEKPLEKKYCLSVTYRDQTYFIYETGDKAIGDLKKDVYNLTGIPPSRQEWSSFLEEATDTSLLEECSLNEPVHYLTVTDKFDLSPLLDHGLQGFQSLSSSEDEQMLKLDRMSLLVDQLPLIPEDVSSPAEAIQTFTSVFEARYGVPHPQFYEGSLAEAFHHAHQRPVVLFLHHDRAISANIFISNVLCSEKVVSALKANFVLWPWDCTLKGNRVKLMEMVAEGAKMLIPTLEQLMQNLELFPTLLILREMGGSIEILRHISGLEQVRVQELLGALEAAQA